MMSDHAQSTRWLAVTLVWLAMVWLVRADDQLVLTDAPDVVLDVIILSETDKVIEYRDATGSQKIEAWRVESILREDASMPYRQALQFLGTGNYLNAFKRFSEVQKAGGASNGNWQEAYVDYYMTYCLFELSKNHAEFVGKAVELLESFVKKFPIHRFTGAARTHLGLIQIQQKKYAEAKAIFEQVDGNSGRRDLKATARYGLAQLAHAQNDSAAALKICSKTFQEHLFNHEIIALARKMLLEEQKSGDEGYKWGQFLVAQVDKSLRNDAYEFLALAETQLKKYEDAFIHFLKAKLLYLPKLQEPTPLAEYNMLICLKILMRENPEQYPEWEYRGVFDSLFARLNKEQRKNITSL